MCDDDDEPWCADRALTSLRDALETSSVIQYVRASAQLQLSAALTPLSTHEIEQLEQRGNTAEDWRQVVKTTAAPLAVDHFRNCAFQGRVVLGVFTRTGDHVLEDGVRFSSGCYRTTLRNVAILDDALVQDTLLLHNVYVAPRACILRCGPVVFHKDDNTPPHVFGNGTTLHVGVETGGRDIRVVADLPFDLAVAIGSRRSDRAFLQSYDAVVDAFVAQLALSTTYTIVAAHAQLLQCSRIANCFIGESAVVTDALVEHSTLLSTATERTIVQTNSIVRHTLVQWRCVVETLSVVTYALLCDCAHVARHAVVQSAVVGPNTSIAQGEVTSSFVGPFVGFHHHALLIATFWPRGKGNVGYGANVGSNHTLKAPDQELIAGEGVFFGLGTNVKFPSNFVASPFAVIATGVTTLPQRVAMPFALINTPGHVLSGVSPAINEISPAWVLQHSVFTVLRNAHKFATRNRSHRTRIAASLFRRETIAFMKAARNELVAAAGTATLALALDVDNSEAVFTDTQVPGLGKNYMRESARRDGIAAYTFFIQLFALDALLLHVESGRVAIDDTVGAIDCDTYDLSTLAEEFGAATRVRACLEELVVKRMAVATNAAAGKARDDARGRRIIPDYDSVHEPVDDEPVIVLAKRAAADVQTRVGRFVSHL